VRVLAPSVEDFPLFGPSSALGEVPSSIPTATGQYQFVFEVRDAEGVGVIARGNAMYSWVEGVRRHRGTLTKSDTWTSDLVHFLEGPVEVRGTAVLTIEPGTVVLGSSAGPGTLAIWQGAKLLAEGNPMQPILFTSEHRVGGALAATGAG